MKSLLVSLISGLKGVVAGMGAGIALVGAVSFFPMVTVSTTAIFASSAIGAVALGSLSVISSLKTA